MRDQQDSKARLLDAALTVIRAKGYAAARIEDVCLEAGLTKGSFFHHFKSKDEMALAAVAHWGARTSRLFADAPCHQPADPVERIIAYIDFRKSILVGELPEFTCLLGTIVQEAYLTHPDITAACGDVFTAHMKTLEGDIREAVRTYPVQGNWTPESLARHIQTVIQGGFVLAKAQGSAAVAAESLDHLRRYIALLFGSKARRRTADATARPGPRARARAPSRKAQPARPHRGG